MFTKSNSRCLGQLIVAGAAMLILPAVLRTGYTTRTEPGSVDPSTQTSVTLDPTARQAGADESWWHVVSAELQRQEYVVSPTSKGLQAPNRAQNLRTTFGENDIEVLPQTEKDVIPPWRFTWATTGFGRPGRMKEVSPSAPSAAGARVTYRRDGWSEWYENSAKGLEQGFTLDRRPEGEGPLQIVGTLPAALRPVLREDGAVDFLTEHEACAIRYGELHVWDAEEQELPAKLALAGNNTLAIEIDDQDAAYPVMVDPLMTSPAWIAEGNQQDAHFSWVSTAGDVNGDGFSDVIVGANFYDNGETDEGQVFVYHGSAAGLSITPAWTTESNQASSAFGSSVSTAGDVNGDGFSDVIVGAYGYDNSESNEGRAFVYHGSAAGLSSTPAWTTESNQVGAFFGAWVSTAGDVNGDGFSDVIVGAYGYDNGESNEGRSFVYHGSAAGLSSTPAWTTESNQVGASFGAWVSTAGDVNGDGFSDAIVGAFAYDNGESNEGRAFVYHGSAAGLTTSPTWTAEGNQIDAWFGSSVATAGDVNGDGFSDVIVDAMNYDNGQTNEGRTFVYSGSPSGLGLSPSWTAESDQAQSRWGGAATAGDVDGDGFSDIIVGNYLYANDQAAEGRALVYRGSAAGLTTSATWIAEGNQIDAWFGASVATAGDVNGDGYSDVIVGAYLYDNGETDEGRAFVYHGSAGTLATTATWIAEGSQVGSQFGITVATAGDVNGDGYSDIIVYVAGYDNGQTDEGQALVYHGSATGLSTLPAWAVESDQQGASDALASNFTTVATAGDVNGDGFSDVIVGFAAYDNDQVDEGRVLVYHGSAAGLATSPAWTAESNQVDSSFGHSVATAGDVNGDGFSDILVGANEYDNGQTNEGRAYAYYGSPGGLASTPAWTAESNSNNSRFGWVVATAGDLNADGFSDVVVGAPYYSNVAPLGGAAFVYLGSVSGLATTTSPPWTIGGGNNELVGSSAGTAGDFNGDGFADLILGFPTSIDNHGRADVVLGSPSGLLNFATLVALGALHLGEGVGTAGDVNGDRFSDVIVSANIGVGGKAYVFHGRSNGGVQSSDWSVGTNGPSGGGMVATAGDVNGDGFSDVIVGDPFGSSNRAFVHLGNGGDGLDRIPLQTRTDDSAPIWLLGNSDSDSAFRLQALGRTPAGRGRVRLQYEVKPANIPFDGTGLVIGDVANTGTPGANGSSVELSQLTGGLSAETLYHWRLRILTDSPFFPRSRWLWLPYNAPGEADVRTGEATTAVAEGAQGSAPGVRLMTIAPNPFASTSRLVYTLPQGGRHRLAVYDVLGREVLVLADGTQRSGSHTVNWDGRDARGNELSSGVYFIRLESNGQVAAKKVVIER